MKAGYNTVSNEDGSAAIGGTGGDFVELGEAEAGGEFAMGMAAMTHTKLMLVTAALSTNLVTST